MNAPVVKGFCKNVSLFHSSYGTVLSAYPDTNRTFIAGRTMALRRLSSGPLMCGITTQCAQLGDCSINDIMIVVYNVGNFVLALVASLVFLMYVIGGFYFLIARGDSHMVEKGKNYLKYSTFGLIIVFLAYALIKTLESVLESGTFSQ